MIMTRNSIRTIPMVIAAAASFAASAFGQVTSELSSRFLARGEEARLSIVIDGIEPEPPIAAPLVPEVRIEQYRQGLIRSRSNRSAPAFSFDYILSSDKIGRHVIPPVTISAGGKRYQSPALEFWVFDPSELKMTEATVGDQIIRYYAGFHTAKPSVYEGEAMAAEIKIYVPRQFGQYVEDWGVPEFERDGVTAWRFEPADRRDLNQAMLLGQAFYALSYPSVLAPTRSGKVGIGPARLRLTSAALVAPDFGGFPKRVYQETYLDIPKLEFESKPLPSGAPKGFQNAVGRFAIEASIAKTEITQGESLAVTLTVSGTGNLDALHAPALSDLNGWKVYNPISVPRGDERRELSGTAVFHQGLLPLEMKVMVPPFELVYFDPEESVYKTAVSEPVQLIMLPSTKAPAADAGPPPALSMPIERMNDILAIVNPAQLTTPASFKFPWWSGHAAGALLALILIAKAVWMKVAHRFRKDPVRDAKEAELRGLRAIPAGDDIAFLRAAGAFVERWHGASRDTKLTELLAERDRLCFRSEKAGQPLAKGRRDEILRTLRQITLTAVLAFTMGLINQADAAETSDINDKAKEAYEASKYEEAIRLWQSAGDHKELSADVLYNIGNASYRIGSPGYAALYYRRALLKDSTHAEARQNLRFIERKHGSISVTYSNYQYTLAKIPLAWWKGLFWGGIWVVALSILVFPATRQGAGLRAAAATLLVIAPLCISAAALGWYYYPNDSAFAPVARQAVFVAPKTILHTDAARTSPEVIDAPEGSLCEIRQISGKWAYVSFATKTRGWVPVTSIEKIIPDKPPGVPKVIPTPTDDSNA
jgi:tetratricopeptide (TPR) repeat protein